MMATRKAFVLFLLALHIILPCITASSYCPSEPSVEEIEHARLCRAALWHWQLRGAMLLRQWSSSLRRILPPPWWSDCGVTRILAGGAVDFLLLCRRDTCATKAALTSEVFSSLFCNK
uniref:Putative secreted protein n=1 Tax=Amblyomma americanum TaxID=6943 RepID=A0A0C9RWE9_AMBAM